MTKRYVNYVKEAVVLLYQIFDDYGLTQQQRHNLIVECERTADNCQYYGNTITVYRSHVEYALQHSPIRDRLPVSAGAKKAGIRQLDP